MMNDADKAQIQWQKSDSLVPAVIQDSDTRQVLMLGYMNQEALEQTLATKRVTFYSRSKRRLWVKGETSGNFITAKEIRLDCDHDTLLVLAEPHGPPCHAGTQTCFGDTEAGVGLLVGLEKLIAKRERDRPSNSYTTSLFSAGLPRIAQKVAEEAIETILAATTEPARVKEEAADLLFHLLVLLRATNTPLEDVLMVLQQRAGNSATNSKDLNVQRPAKTLPEIVAHIRAGENELAKQCLVEFIVNKFPLVLDAASIEIRKDNISLNSVNGSFADRERKKYFFKFHLEEAEADTLNEYYRANILIKHGFPVEEPLFVSRDVGEQFVIYPYLACERLFDVCRSIEHGVERETDKIVAAQGALDRLIVNESLKSLTKGTRQDYLEQPILQLFFWRLVDRNPDGTCRPGGRYRRFYVDQDFILPGGINLPYAELGNLKWNINGNDYDVTLEEAFARARKLLSPDSVLTYPACVAHGDDHNGNVWVKPSGEEGVELSLFDPAFAGEKIPALLAEVKATFHNIFAHPDWLYDPKDADAKLNSSVQIKNGTLFVRHNWALSKLRRRFLLSKQNHFWIPMLRELRRRDWLALDWQAYVRAGLFCCPTLVMNLRAGAGAGRNTHTPKTSLVGLSIAIMCANPPLSGTDPVHSFFGNLTQALQSDETR